VALWLHHGETQETSRSRQPWQDGQAIRQEIERQEGAVSKAMAGENGKYGRVGDARRITLAVVYLANNVQGELSAHTVTVSNLHGKKIARTIECVAHEP